MPTKYYRGTYELNGKSVNSRHCLPNVPEDYSSADAAAVIQAQHPEMRNLRVVELSTAGAVTPLGVNAAGERELKLSPPPSIGTEGAHGIPNAVGPVGMAPNVVQPVPGRAPVMEVTGQFAKEPVVPIPADATPEQPTKK